MCESPIITTLTSMSIGSGFRAELVPKKPAFVRLDFDLPVAEDALQRVPHAGLREGIRGIDDEIAAVGLDHRSGLDAREVGPPDAVPVHDTFDRAEQVLVPRVGLEDHRRSCGLGVVDDDVHLIFQESVVLPRLARVCRTDAVCLLPSGGTAGGCPGCPPGHRTGIPARAATCTGRGVRPAALPRPGR